jgi:hypothetical protein
MVGMALANITEMRPFDVFCLPSGDQGQWRGCSRFGYPSHYCEKVLFIAVDGSTHIL